MRYILLTATFSITLIGGIQAQLVDVIHEVIETGGIGSIPAGYSTYRIYARLQDPTDRISAVFGTTAPLQEHHLKIASTDSGNAIWNSQFGGTSGSNMSCTFWSFFPDAQFDSYITIGVMSGTSDACVDCFGTQSTVFMVGNPISIFPTTFHPSGGGLAPDLLVLDGSWFIPNDGSCNGFGQGCDNRILLAQLTVPTGTLEYWFNIAMFDEGIGANQILYVHTLNDPLGMQGDIYETDGSCLGLVFPDPVMCIDVPYIEGCIDPLACNYIPEANTPFICNCTYPGCTDPGACNFASWAGCDDGSCNYSMGCTDYAACNYDPTAACDDGSCNYPGCTDQQSCNYDPTAGCDNGSCEGLAGCMDPSADIYNPEADCEDGSCGYAYSGFVFHDVNSDGLFNGADTPLGFQQVIISELGFLAITDDNGNFTMYGIPEGTHTLEIVNPTVFPFNTTPGYVVLNVPFSENTGIQFGLSATEPLFGICVDIYPNTSTYTCSQWSNHNICFRNEGNLPISGVVRVDYDPLFTDIGELTPIDSIVGNSIYMSYENLDPGVMFFYDIALKVPDFNFMGDSLTNHCVITGYYNDEFVAMGTKARTHVVTCSYDPNDKQAYPVGYTDDHLVLPETEIEYLVRFQNTGNGPAFEVNVRDTLDANLDLSTFRMVANSHSVQTSLNPITREVVFHFPDIMLPDSTSDEPGSHGLISYAISPIEGLAQGTQIHNTAHIFFDFNPAVVTNTTLHTIYNCEGQSDFIVSADPCIYEPVEFEATGTYAATFEWQTDGVFSGTSSAMESLLLTEGLHEITLTTTNPLCSEIQSEELLVSGLQGDFNCSHVVNVEDLFLFMGSYGCLVNCGGYDMNNDNMVTVNDLITLIVQYGNIN